MFFLPGKKTNKAFILRVLYDELANNSDAGLPKNGLFFRNYRQIKNLKKLKNK